MTRPFTNPALCSIAALLVDLHRYVPRQTQRAETAKRMISALQTLSLLDGVVDENYVLKWLLAEEEVGGLRDGGKGEEGWGEGTGKWEWEVLEGLRDWELVDGGR